MHDWVALIESGRTTRVVLLASFKEQLLFSFEHVDGVLVGTHHYPEPETATQLHVKLDGLADAWSVDGHVVRTAGVRVS